MQFQRRCRSDYSCALQARYIYDAWGNTKVVDASNNTITSTTHIGNINPIRYRGYYYDKETNFYYLGSRYYDSAVGRFINADDASVASLDISSLYDKNLYAYCDDNPMKKIDVNGCCRFLYGDLIKVKLFEEYES